MPTPEDKPVLLADKDFGFSLPTNKKYKIDIINTIKINLDFLRHSLCKRIMAMASGCFLGKCSANPLNRSLFSIHTPSLYDIFMF
jgi:hypothetical protein